MLVTGLAYVSIHNPRLVISHRRVTGALSTLDSTVLNIVRIIHQQSSVEEVIKDMY
ncbi:MAG: hypothetical protein QXW44_05960 [Pyrobaculum sp.]